MSTVSREPRCPLPASLSLEILRSYSLALRVKWDGYNPFLEDTGRTE